MAHRHKIFIITIFTIVTLSLPLFSNATVGKTVASVGISLGEKIDKTVSFAIALPSRTTHALATAIDSAALPVRQAGNTIAIAVEDIAAHVKTQMTNAQSMAEIKMSRLAVGQAKLHTKAQSLSLSFQRTLKSSYGILNRIPSQVWDKVQDDTISYLSSVKEGLSSIASAIPHNPSRQECSQHSCPPSPRPAGLTLRGGDETTPPLNLRGARGVREDETPNSSPLTIVERIIEKVSEQSPPALTISSSLPSPLPLILPRPPHQHPCRQPRRLNLQSG